MKNRILVFRAENKTTQAQLAEKIEISRKAINAIENGMFVPSIFIALKIA